MACVLSLGSQTCGPEQLSDETILRDYALNFNMTTQLRAAPINRCSAACRDWWPHPSGTSWVCSSHHRIHHCVSVCEFLGNDIGNSDCTACPVSGQLGRFAPMFVSASRRSARRTREAAIGSIPLSQRWILVCVRHVVRDTSNERLLHWSNVIWTLLQMLGVHTKWNHQRALNITIGLLTTIPRSSITAKGVTLIPMLPYLTHSVPDKLLTTVTHAVSMRTARFTGKGRVHTITCSMGKPHNVTVAMNCLYDILNGLPSERLSIIKLKLDVYFCDPRSPSDPPLVVLD
jgi:hypothetical protein